jgi:glycosyltransferase involved in cell wall biosynthesis
MRVLIIHQHFSTPNGAAPARSHAMARALTLAGHEVTVATGASQGCDSGLPEGVATGRIAAGFTVARFDVPYANAMGAAARAAAFLRFAGAITGLALRPWDAIVASSTPPSVALPALLARRLRGTPFLFEMRDPWPELLLAMGALRPGPAAWALSALSSAACRHAAGVIALSEGMAEVAVARGAARGAVQVIPNGCDLDQFGPHVAPWRPDGVPQADMLAVYAGAMGPANGLDQVLDAAARLHARGGAGVHIALAGEGAERGRLAERAGHLPNVTMLPPMPRTHVARLLAGADAALMCLAAVPEFAELTSPNKLMDALAAGLPVISNVPGRAARWLQDGACGLTVADADGMADALATLAAHPDRRRAMGRAARAMAVHRFDRTRHAARFVAAVEALPRARTVLATA